MIWRRSIIPLWKLVLFFVVIIILITLLEKTVVWRPDYQYDLKITAAKRMEKGLRLLSEYLKEVNPGIFHLQYDPAKTGLIGDEYTPITTTLGSLKAKQTSINPDMAAIFIDLLLEAGVKAGETVAMRFTGSFPALNLAAIIAAETLGANPVIISSVGASSWGANRSNLTWLDLENFFYHNKIIYHHSEVVTLGGGNDQGEGFWEDGLKIAQEAIVRNKYTLLEVNSLSDAIAKQYHIYMKSNPVLFINVGGAHASFGKIGHQNKYLFNGLIREIIPLYEEQDSLIFRFLQKGVPAINMLNITDFAVKYELPLAPLKITRPGKSKIYYTRKYSGGFVLVAVVIILLSICWLFRKRKV